MAETVPACRCGYLPCTADPDTAIEALWRHIEEAHVPARCGECGGVLVDHACVDCGTRHGGVL